jgi:predicted lipoprotein with Yx(FWY)xxD motif
MSKSKMNTNSRKFLTLGTMVVVFSLLIAACSASPIPETGGTPGVVSTSGVEVTPAVEETQAVENTPAVEATMPSTSATKPSTSGTQMSPTKAATSGVAEEAEIEVATDPTLGQILVGKDKMTLYAFTQDTTDTVTCTGECLQNWPPLFTMGSPDFGAGVDKTLFKAVAGPDGKQVVSYNGHPLYYYVGDKAAGDVTGQGVGGKWFVVTPAGELVQ